MSQTSSAQNNRAIRLALPKGRMHEGVFALLADAGIRLRAGGRTYRPAINLENFEVKILKPQSIIEMLHLGSRDIGFAGADWCAELGADLVELLDTELDPVQVVMAAPPALLENGRLPKRPLVVASEYMRLTRRWLDDNKIDATLVRSYGATEVFPPEDADVIVDNTATGSTLAANGLQITHTLMKSSTRLYAHARALDDAGRKEAIDRFVMLVRSVLEARSRVMLEVNVTPEVLEAVVAALPSMREATVSPLHMARGFAVKAAVRRDMLHRVIPEIKARGGTDVVVTALAQIVP